jgi:hypothetical protein
LNAVRAQIRETAKATGREPELFLRQWVQSLSQLPDDEFNSLQYMHYPQVAEAQRRWEEHATIAGHTPVSRTWRSAVMFELLLRCGYGGM